ncbi:homocitrate synthase/isopropylmalate synthase family protein [Sorangium sp. KYC3313]|uniref:homocitrate synthase/isopropylmalate synthase family protein n=1 Tax=Sorangium sp. KYC3313 TaxID=3449740 RepID=UPI003F88DF78
MDQVQTNQEPPQERGGRVITFYDTTLRDGEQMPGVAFSRGQQEHISRALDAMGLDEIEIGFAASGPAQRADMAHIAGLGLRARLLSLCRPLKEDIDAARQTGVSGVILVTSTSDILMKHKLRKEYPQVIDQACRAVAYAASLGLFVQLSLEDATRTSEERIQDVAKRAVQAGAMRIGVSDTVGVGTPRLMTRLVQALRAVVSVPIAAHCHDDFGLAVANSLAAVEGGAEVLSTTINGIGERSGNACTEECALALERLYGYKTNFNFARVYDVSRLVAECARVPIPPNKAIVGQNSFRHESGIHVAAMLQHPGCYEPYDPALIGGKREIVLGKTSGRAALRHFAGEIGDTFDDETCRRILDKIKLHAERGDRIDAGQLQEIVAACRS